MMIAWLHIIYGKDVEWTVKGCEGERMITKDKDLWICVLAQAWAAWAMFVASSHVWSHALGTFGVLCTEATSANSNVPWCRDGAGGEGPTPGSDVAVPRCLDRVGAVWRHREDGEDGDVSYSCGSLVFVGPHPRHCPWAWGYGSLHAKGTWEIERTWGTCMNRGFIEVSRARQYFLIFFHCHLKESVRRYCFCRLWAITRDPRFGPT